MSGTRLAHLMDVIVLAGGFGTRLRPWTVDTPKPLLPILDRTMIEHVVSILPESMVSRVLIAAGYGENLLNSHGFDIIMEALYKKPDNRSIGRFNTRN